MTLKQAQIDQHNRIQFGSASVASDSPKQSRETGYVSFGNRAVVEGAFIRIRRDRSHTGHFRWLAGAKPTGEYLARVQTESIPSPYAYSPSVIVYDWQSIPCVCFETSHKVYDVFSIPTNLLRFKSDDEATDWHIKYGKRVV